MRKLRVLTSGKYDLRLEYDEDQCHVILVKPDDWEMPGMVVPASFADDLATFLLGIDSWEERTDGQVDR